MIQSKYFEDYEVGSVRESLGRTITETDIVVHAGQSGDFYPHHMDAEWCKTQEFMQRVAHGTLVFTVAVGLSASEVNPEACRSTESATGDGFSLRASPFSQKAFKSRHPKVRRGGGRG